MRESMRPTAKEAAPTSASRPDVNSLITRQRPAHVLATGQQAIIPLGTWFDPIGTSATVTLAFFNHIPPQGVRWEDHSDRIPAII